MDGVFPLTAVDVHVCPSRHRHDRFYAQAGVDGEELEATVLPALQQRCVCEVGCWESERGGGIPVTSNGGREGGREGGGEEASVTVRCADVLPGRAV